MPYLFTPPQRVDYAVLEGSLRAKVYVSWTVWKDTTLGWLTQETPAFETLAAAAQLLPGSGVTPSIVDDTTGASLAAWVASYSPPTGILPPTCEPIQP